MLKPKNAAVMAGLWKCASAPAKKLWSAWPAGLMVAAGIAVFVWGVFGWADIGGWLASVRDAGSPAQSAAEKQGAQGSKAAAKPVLAPEVEGLSVPAGATARIESDRVEKGVRVMRIALEMPAPAPAVDKEAQSGAGQKGQQGEAEGAPWALMAFWLAGLSYWGWCWRLASKGAFAPGGSLPGNVARGLNWMMEGGVAKPLKPFLDKSIEAIVLHRTGEISGPRALAWAAGGGACAGFVGAVGISGFLLTILAGIWLLYCAGQPVIWGMGGFVEGFAPQGVQFWAGCALDAVAAWKLVRMAMRGCAALAPGKLKQKAARAYESLADMGADGYAAAEAKALGKSCQDAQGPGASARRRL